LRFVSSRPVVLPLFFTYVAAFFPRRDCLRRRSALAFPPSFVFVFLSSVFPDPFNLDRMWFRPVGLFPFSSFFFQLYQGKTKAVLLFSSPSFGRRFCFYFPPACCVFDYTLPLRRGGAKRSDPTLILRSRTSPDPPLRSIS